MQQTYLQNPRHTFQESVVKGLNAKHARQLDVLSNYHELAVKARSTAEERKQLHSIGDERYDTHTARAADILNHYRERVFPMDWIDVDLNLHPLDNAPEQRAADFWWAQTQLFGGGGGISPTFQSDGVHFFGQAPYNRDPLFSFSVGAGATFELQPERMPHSASGRWHSAPHIELFGTITGWTNIKHCPWACDDKWSKCFLFLRHEAVQFIDDIGTWASCGRATSFQTLINEEGNGRRVDAHLPGFKAMPPLTFGLFRRDRSVLVDIEVRFDVQLEGDSFISFSPGDGPNGSVLLRHFQWPCIGL